MLKLVPGTWTVASLVGKKPELVVEGSDVLQAHLDAPLWNTSALRRNGLPSVLELPRVRGSEQAWGYS